MVKHDEAHPSRAAESPRNRRVEFILIALVLFWAAVVFGVLILASIQNNQRAVDLMPTVAPSPKS